MDKLKASNSVISVRVDLRNSVTNVLSQGIVLRSRPLHQAKGTILSRETKTLFHYLCCSNKLRLATSGI